MADQLVDDLAVPLAGLAAMGVSAALVGVRGEIRPEVTAVVLAAVVALGGRFGGRAAGVVGALVAAASFDFMHTEPYLSLKIANASDALVTVALLLVGLIVGGLAASASRAQRRLRSNIGHPDGLWRVLGVARLTDSPEDIEAAVRAELLGLLHLEDCFFTPNDVIALPTIQPSGAIEGTHLHHYTHDGFELPRSGVAIEVTAYGANHGYLICIPTEGVGVALEDRRIAAQLADVLALARSGMRNAA